MKKKVNYVIEQGFDHKNISVNNILNVRETSNLLEF